MAKRGGRRTRGGRMAGAVRAVRAKKQWVSKGQRKASVRNLFEPVMAPSGAPSSDRSDGEDTH